MAPTVILLRTPDVDREDKYERTFSEANLRAFSVPVLQTSLKNIEVLSKLNPHDFAGVILTSARASEAWKEAISDYSSWSNCVFYAVGKSTSSALPDIKFSGDSSGTSENLAHFIAGDPALQDPSRIHKPLLYLTGDKNRDTLSNIVTSAGLVLKPLQVYETRGSDTFEYDFLEVYDGAKGDTDNLWIAFFAPSSSEFALPILRKHLNILSARERAPAEVPPSPHDRLTPRVVAIGPTTADFLRDSLQLHVDVVASKPSPEELLNAIKSYGES